MRQIHTRDIDPVFAGKLSADIWESMHRNHTGTQDQAIVDSWIVQINLIRETLGKDGGFAHFVLDERFVSEVCLLFHTLHEVTRWCIEMPVELDSLREMAKELRRA